MRKSLLFLLLSLLCLFAYADNSEFTYLNKALRYVKDTTIEGHKFKGWVDSKNKPAVFGTFFDKNEYATGQFDNSGKMNGYVTAYIQNIRIFVGEGKWNNKTKKVDPSGWGAQLYDHSSSCSFMICDESTYYKGGLAFSSVQNVYMKNGVVSDAYEKEVEIMYNGNKDKIKKICQSNNVKYVEDANVYGLRYSGGWKDGQPYLYGAYQGLVYVADGYYNSSKSTVFHGYFKFDPSERYEKFIPDNKFYEKYQSNYTCSSIDETTGDTIVEETNQNSHLKYILSKDGVKFYELFNVTCKSGSTFYLRISKNLGDGRFWGIIVDEDEIYEGELQLGNKGRFDFFKGNYGKSYSANGRFVDQTLGDGKLLFTFASGNTFYSLSNGTHNGINYHFGECRYPDGRYCVGYFNSNDMSKAAYGDVYDKNGNLLTSYVESKFSDIKNIDAKILQLRNLHSSVVNGFGKCENDDYIYEGNFQSCQKNGKGKITYKKTNNVYEGDWKNNTMEGIGTFTWGDGDKYEGEWANGMMEGKGIYKWKDGHVYDGKWKEGKRHGLGMDSLQNGTWSVGQWKNGNLSSGRGVLINEEGSYEGEFGKSYSRDGRGEMTWKDGHVYYGNWSNNKRHGEGLDSFPNGIWSKGIWEFGQLVSGIGKIVLEDGYLYEGELGNGCKPNKNGTVTHTNGTNYHGYFTKGELMRGNGTIVTNGERIDGTFNRFGPLDSAKITFADGTTMIAKWKQKMDGAVFKASTDGTTTINYSNGSQYIGEIENHSAKGNSIIIIDSLGNKYQGGYENERFIGDFVYVYSNGDSLKAIWSETGLVVKTDFVYVWSDGRRCEGVIGKDNEFTKCDYYNADGSDAKRKEYKTWQVNPIPDNIKIEIPSANSIFKY